jgi:hypothetical protein
VWRCEEVIHRKRERGSVGLCEALKALGGPVVPERGLERLRRDYRASSAEMRRVEACGGLLTPVPY